MDSTVIQEIANQLGIAADDAGELIQQYLPQYANLQIFYNVMGVIISAVIIAITVVIGRKVFIHKRDSIGKMSCVERIVHGDGCTSTIVISAIIVAIFMITIVFDIRNIIGWAVFPEASLIDMVLNSIG